MTKLKIWKESTSFEEAEKVWDKGAEEAAQKFPLKIPKNMPTMVGITEETKKNLKWKSLKWMVKEDHSGEIRRNVLKHPLKYPFAFLKSVIQREAFKRDADFFFYGIKSLSAFEKLLEKKETLLVVGFSYCHKPHECPSGRFTTECINDANNPVCRQCFIGKCSQALPEQNCIPLYITTIHYIGEQIFNIINENPEKEVIFIITACEMTLTMFGDYGNMSGIKGIGIRLDGRICNTMKAFELSERGVKPGLTIVLDQTQRKILELIKLRCNVR